MCDRLNDECSNRNETIIRDAIIIHNSLFGPIEVMSEIEKLVRTTFRFLRLQLASGWTASDNAHR